MRNFLAGLGVALLVGACAGGAVPPLGLQERHVTTIGEAVQILSVHNAIDDSRRPQADRDRDEARHPADILTFVGVQPGMRIADIGPGSGYYTRLFAVAVSDNGHVYGIDRPNRAPDQPRASLAVAAQYTNVTIVQQGYQGWTVDQPLDAIFISQIYHDFHVPANNLDVPAINRGMFAALRPGGELVIIDHSAVAGFDPARTDEVHRIDQAVARRELEAAGFVFEAESQVLRNPADTRTERVFETDIRGHTDQFVMRFREAGVTLLPPNPNAFARSPLDRAGHHRTDPAWLSDALANEQTLVVAFHQGKPFLYEEGPALRVRWLGGNAPAELGVKGGATLFLGVDADGVAHFAFEVADPERLGDLGEFTEMRPAAARLEFDKLPILGTAKSVFEWHARNRFCANCGSPSDIAEAGWKRVCPQCNGEHFPRFDPVCIMLPVIGDKCLLGRQRPWPKGMHSALAGFIEPGETIEEAVARETLEEAGLAVREVRLHSTQPWPFPHSLMIGAICEVTDDHEKVDDKELESVRWFTREEMRQMLRNELPGFFCPPPFAIAHQLIKTWAAEG